MKHCSYFLISLFLFFSACAGADTRTNKSFKNTENTIFLKDLTARDYRMVDAGSQLESALEDVIARSMFIIARENPKYILKYKVLNYSKGSRVARFSTFGLSQSAHGLLEVKVALYLDGQKVGAWTIDAWIKGGIAGGDPRKLFQQAANEIMNRLRGDL